MASARNVARSPRRPRKNLALSRLTALIALGFMPGLSAVGATFSDQVTFSTSNQSLWGSGVGSGILYSPSLDLKWGTYAGNAASQLFSFNGITSLTDPVFGASLGRYGVSASFSSSGHLGLGYNANLRGGTFAYTQTLNPVLTLPDSFAANTRFTASSVDSLRSAPTITAVMPQVSTAVAATLKFDGSLSATGCIVDCTSTTQNFSINPGPIQVMSFDSQRDRPFLVAGVSRPFLLAGKPFPVDINTPDGAKIGVGTFKVLDTFKSSDCVGAGDGSLHCGTSLFSADIDLSAMAFAYGAPVDVDRSYAGINFKSRLIDVGLVPEYGLALDLKVQAAAFTRLVFDKPVTEFLANGQSVLHSDGVVNVVIGSAASLSFGSQVGRLIQRTHYLDNPSFSTAVGADASMALDSKIGCGFSVTAFGTNVVPDTTSNCLTSTSTTLSTGTGKVYSGTSNLNTVRTSATYQGLGNTNQLTLTGLYTPGNPVNNAGAGSLASLAPGQQASISGVGANWTNTRAAQVSIAGSLRLESGGLLDNSEGAELVIERGGSLTTTGFDHAYALSELRNSKSATPGAAAAVINNFGTVDINGRITNSGIINNFGDFKLNAAILSFNGGVFNNGAGGVLTIGDALYTLNLGSATAGTINLLPGSKLSVSGGIDIAPGYKQINEGEITIGAGGQLSVFGELQFGNGNLHGSMVSSGELKTNASTGGVVSFLRSDDTRFSNLVTGSGGVTKRGPNTLTLTADHTYTGLTSVESGRLVLTGQSRSSELRINTNATLELQAASDRDNTASNRFTGGGNLVKTGAGTLRWGTSSAVFALDAGARIEVQGGMLVAGSGANDDWSRNRAGLLVADGATFWGAENNVRVDTLSGSGRIHSGYQGAGYEAFRFGVAGGSGTFSGVLADTDAANRHIGSFIKEGAGTQVLTGNNTFTGGLAILQGQVQIGDGGTSGSLAARQIVNQAELSFSRSDDSRFDGTIVGTGNLTKLGAGQLTLTQSQPTLSPGYSGLTSVRGGTLVLTNINHSRGHDIAQGAVLELRVASGNRDGTVATQFSGQGTLRKTGAGQSLWGASAATFALSAGSLIDVQAGSFVGGSSANEDWRLNQSALNVATGASFAGVEANVRVDSLSGAGRISSGYATAGYSAFTFGVAGGSASFSGVLADTDAANGHLGAFTKVGAGTQVLTGANTFTGTLSILGGQLQVGDGGTSGLLAARLINNEAELSFSRSDDSRFDGLIAGSGNLTKLGVGRLTLAQAPFFILTPYTGVTSVRAGTLVLAGTDHSRAHDIAQGAVLELQVASGSRDGAVATLFSGQGTLRKTGGGQSLWGASAATFAMAAGSLIDVQVGSFVGGSSANEDWRLNQSALNVAAGASFAGVEANVRVDALSGGGRVSSGYASAGYTAFTMGVANGSGDFSGVLADSSAGNAGHFVKVGSGTQTLSGSNTYSGGTTVAGGVLSVARDANLGSGSLAFAGGTLRNTGAFITTRAVTLGAGGGVFDTAGGFLTINSNVGGAGGLGKTGGDILTLAGAHGYTGATVISAGTLKFSANGVTASSVASPSIAIASGARLIFADSQTYAGAITGAGLLMHEFGGTTTLTGSATHNGGTLISGGTLQVGHGGSRGTLAGDVVDNGLLAFNRSDHIVFAGTISGSGGVAQRGSGTLTLTGANTYSGVTTVSAGAIQLNGSALHSAFNVGAGATLGGNAQVGTLRVAGTLAPGNSPGLISAGATTFASGGQYLWEINDGSGLAGTGHDLLSVAGTLTVDASPASRFTVSLRSLLGDNTPGTVVHFDAKVDHRYTLVSTSGGILGFSADEFAIDSSGFGNATFGGRWAVAVSGQDLTLNFTAAVPEPGTYAMLLAGLLAVGAAARRRRPAAAASRG